MISILRWRLNSLFVSLLLKLELLGWNPPTQIEANLFAEFVNDAVIFHSTEAVIEKTIEIRKLKKIKLPDAIITATTMIHNFTLLTKNTNDFKNISKLEFINPMSN